MTCEWELRRNCSLAPREATLACALLCAGAFGVALVFALHGLWIVLAFALLEIAGVIAALVHYARHATDRERIALAEGCLLVERIEAGQHALVRLDPTWTRIALPDTPQRKLIELESRGVKVAIGSFVSETRRQQVAVELRHALRTSSLLA
jgi:uncharacterized membrane protein